MNKIRISMRLTAILVVAGTVAVAAQTMSTVGQTRDPRAAASAANGSSLIAGVLVTDEQTPKPVRHATVTVSSEDRSTNKTVITNDNGAFSFTGLVPGRYTLGATKPAFLRAAYGAKRPDRPGTPITLAAGQQVTGLAMRMSRGGIIAGVLQDENGRPLPGAAVRLLQFRMQNGERVLAPVPLQGALGGEATDDRGAYRLFGLTPGDYVISATPRLAGITDVKQMTPEEIAAVMKKLTQPAPTPTPGVTPGRGNATPNPGDQPDAIMVGYTPVYYPGTTSAAGAQTIAIGPGEERTGVNFMAQLVRTAKVTGRVVTPDGSSPQGAQLIISESGQTPVLSSSINITSPAPDGKFTFTGLAPGNYTINARMGAPGARGGGGGTATPLAVAGGNVMRVGGPSGPVMWGVLDVTVNGQTLSDQLINLQPGMTVSGKFAFAGVTTAPQDFSRARITLSPAGSGVGTITMGIPSATISPTGEFSISGVTPGKYTFSASAITEQGALATWTLKSASARGRDVTDVPLDITPSGDVNDAVLTFTDQTQQVSGALQDGSGRPAPDYTIIVFPADKQLWNGSTRRTRIVRPATDGKFVVRDLPAGDYRIAAVTDMAPNEANDPAFLEQLVVASYAFTLKDGEKKVQDLKIAGL